MQSEKNNNTLQEPEELDLPVKSKRRSRVSDFGVTEAFWRISLDHGGSGSYVEEIQNLPSWDSPDIFLDHDDQFDDFEDSEDQETGELYILSGEWEEKDKKNEKNKNQSCDTKLILMETFDVVDMNKDWNISILACMYY